MLLFNAICMHHVGCLMLMLMFLMLILLVQQHVMLLLLNLSNICTYIPVWLLKFRKIYCHAAHSFGALFLPFAISTRDLRQSIIDALILDHLDGLDAAGIKIPSLSWVEYQFAPANSGHASCLRYTCELYDVLCIRYNATRFQ
jgi:hypothetical protein